MDYVEPLFRPPSEAQSLLLQVSLGCSHNKCTFCAMYLNKKFKIKPIETVFADIDEAAGDGVPWRRAFLMDGDVLVLKTDHLLKILARIRERLPNIERVGVYGEPKGLKNKTDAELKELRDAGLGIIYHGIESGHDEVLKRIIKGSTAAEAVEAGLRIKEAGILYSAIVLIGVGGMDLSHENAQATAEHLNKVNPDYVGALTLTVVPGTPLYEAQQRGEFVLPEKFAFLEELRTLVRGLEISDCRFHANHPSNYVTISARMPDDKPKILAMLDRVIAAGDESLLRPEFLRGL